MKGPQNGVKLYNFLSFSTPFAFFLHQGRQWFCWVVGAMVFGSMVLRGGGASLGEGGIFVFVHVFWGAGSKNGYEEVKSPKFHGLF